MPVPGNPPATTTPVAFKSWAQDVVDALADVVADVAALPALVEDAAYDATAWNGDTTAAPSKNAVRDKIESMVAEIAGILDGAAFTGDVSVPDEAYGSGWNGSTEVPTKNAVYDKIETLGSGGGGAALADFATAAQTAGAYTLNSTSWANVDTGLDLTLSAAAGDLIEVGMSAVMGSQAVAGYLDAATIVSGSPVTYLSNSTGTPASAGVSGWAKETVNSGFYQNIGGSHPYILQSGDISGGAVTLRLRYKTGSASNLTLYGTTSNVFRWWAKNYGATP